VQAHLFGEPERKPSLSQWWTPPWLAQRLVSWVPRGLRVLEPSCGGGALLAALLRAGHPAMDICALDIERDWASHCGQHFPGIHVDVGDFLAHPILADSFGCVVMNPPFEDNLHLRFVLRALELAPMVIGVFPVSFEFGKERDRELWATRGVVTRRARLPERVDYGGTQSPSFDSVVLRIERRFAPRAQLERQLVVEEVWTANAA
jgi:predicted RNA methylase